MPAHHIGTVRPTAGPGGERLGAGNHLPCGTTIAVRPGSALERLPDPDATGLIQPLRADAAPVLAPVDGEEPAHPPDVRRALLQGFLN